MATDTKQQAGWSEIQSGTATGLSESRRVEPAATTRTDVSSRGALPAPSGKVVTIRSSYAAILSVPYNVAREERKQSNLEGNRPSKPSARTTTD